MVLEHLTNLPSTKPLEEMTREELINYCKGKDALNKALIGAVEIETEQAQFYKQKYNLLKKASNIDYNIYKQALQEIDRLKMTIEIMGADLAYTEEKLEALNK